MSETSGPRMRVGLTGGIGSGKSAVSTILSGYGAVIIDYDQLSRDAVEPGSPALREIEERFGPEIISPSGRLDRDALGEIVFNDDPARRQLEAITHPAIAELALDRENTAGYTVVVHDNPLLAEMGTHEHCDVVIVVDAPDDTRIQRLAANRNMTESDARSRIAAQAPRHQRVGIADVVIDNTDSLNELERQVASFWDRYIAQSSN